MNIKHSDLLEEIEKLCNPPIYYWLKPVKIKKIKLNQETYYDSTWAIEGPVSFKIQSDGNNVSDFQQDQLKAVHLLRKLHSVLPGWANCVVERTSDRMGFRQTRVLKGITALRTEDIKVNTTKDDGIGRGSGHDISRHNSQFEYGYDIPLNALIPSELDGILIGARSISCDTEEKGLIALNAHCGISAAIIVSQACGVAAAQCVELNLEPRELDIQKLKLELKKQKVILSPPQ